jgi:hypothetical protein
VTNEGDLPLMLQAERPGSASETMIAGTMSDIWAAQCPAAREVSASVP